MLNKAVESIRLKFLAKNRSGTGRIISNGADGQFRVTTRYADGTKIKPMVNRKTDAHLTQTN